MNDEINKLLTEIQILEDRKHDLNERIRKIDCAEETAAQKYRIKSTARVLTFILNKYRDGRIPDLETLLVHCLNKLDGNIDGVELDLRTEYSSSVVALPLSKPAGLQKGDSHNG